MSLLSLLLPHTGSGKVRSVLQKVLMTVFDTGVFEQLLNIHVLLVVHNEQEEFAEEASFRNTSNLNLLGISCLVRSYNAHRDLHFPSP